LNVKRLAPKYLFYLDVGPRRWVDMVKAAISAEEVCSFDLGRDCSLAVVGNKQEWGHTLALIGLRVTS